MASFFSLVGGTHIKDSHSLKKKVKKRQDPFTHKSKGYNCLLVLTGAVKRQEWLQSKSPFDALFPPTPNVYCFFFFKSFFVNTSRELEVKQCFYTTEHSCSVIWTPTDHCGTLTAGIKWSITSDSYKGFQHSSVFKRLSKSIHT